MRALFFLALAPLLLACGSDTFTSSDGGTLGEGGNGDGGGEASVSDGGAEGCAPGDPYGAVAAELMGDRGCDSDPNCAIVIVQIDCCTYRAIAVNHAYVGDGGVAQVLENNRLCKNCPASPCLQTVVEDETGKTISCTAAMPATCFTPKCVSLGGGKNGCFAEPN